jgi:hypothetical protein
MNRTIELTRENHVVEVVLDKVLYVQMPSVAPLMNRGETNSSTIFFAGTQVACSYGDAKRVRDAIRGE